MTTAALFLVKLPSDEYRWTLQMISQQWFRYWLGAARQQTITWAIVGPDLCRHIASLDVVNHGILVKNLYR